MPPRGTRGWRLSEETKRKIGDSLRRIRGEDRYNWKGESVSYYVAHMWIRRELGIPFGTALACSVCGKYGEIQMHTVSGLCKRDVTDWVICCRKCHRDLEAHKRARDYIEFGYVRSKLTRSPKPKQEQQNVPQILSLSLRPRSLGSLYGQAETVRAIRKQMATRPPQTWMFVGAAGTGKTSTARILSVAYQCTHQPPDKWGTPCQACWDAQASFSIHEINASDVSGVDELREVAELSRCAPMYGSYRVIIVDEAQRISTAAQNMLLKPFEEPPASTVWIVCTTDPQKILPTLRRRCVTYRLHTLGITQQEDFLKRAAVKAKIALPLEPLFEQVHMMDVGAPALLLQALEKYAAGTSASEAVAGVDAHGIESLRICKAVTSGSWDDVVTNLKDATPEEARWIAASVRGWLRGGLASGLQPEQAAAGILELCKIPFDDSVILHWLWATLYSVTKSYRKR